MHIRIFQTCSGLKCLYNDMSHKPNAIITSSPSSTLSEQVFSCKLNKLGLFIKILGIVY